MISMICLFEIRCYSCYCHKEATMLKDGDLHQNTTTVCLCVPDKKNESNASISLFHTIRLSHLRVISSPSTGSPSCAAVNCCNPSQPLYVFLVLVCLSLLCDLSATCLFYMFLPLLFFNMSRFCACFLFSLTALFQICLFVLHLLF